MKRTPRVFWFLILLVAICALAGGLYGWRVEAASDGGAAVPSNLDAFARIYSLVEKNYADPINPQHAIFGFENANTVGAIPAMLRTLDPHSNFFDARAFARLRENQEGRYFGIGARILTARNRDGQWVTTIAEPMPGSPAFRAGVRPGDTIVKINGKPTLGLDGDTVSKLLKGPRGTTVEVTASREGYAQPIDFAIVRDEISGLSVDDYFLIQPGIAYVHISDFWETTGQELNRALNRLGEKNFKGLILDLRGNPGGLLQAAVQVSDHFLQKGQLIVSHSGRNSKEERYFAERGDRGESYPIVVLINRGTASAAEIVTGALQDHDRALVMGETSFGKGLVQTPYPLSEGTGLLLTTAHYYTPSGRLIQREYDNVSLYDYLYAPDSIAAPKSEVHHTDGGREVFGGGGITPDVKVGEPQNSAVQSQLLSGLCPSFLECGSFFEYGRYYLGVHKTIPRNFTPDDQVVADFRGFAAKRGIILSDKDLRSNEGFIKDHVRAALVGMIYGQDEAQHMSVQNDYVVQKAIEALPQAAALVSRAKKYLASHAVNAPTS